MSKGLEALENLYCAGNLALDYVLEGKQKKDFAIVEKELKALEILLKKLSPSVRQSDDYFSGCVLGSWSNNFELTQEEYNLLKEILL